MSWDVSVFAAKVPPPAVAEIPKDWRGEVLVTLDSDGRLRENLKEAQSVNRYQLLAAEIFAYSYDNYQDHLGIGNIRFDKLMPDEARNLAEGKRDIVDT